MVSAVLDNFMFMFFLPKTSYKPEIRKSMLNSIRGFVNNLECIKDAKLTIKSRAIEVDHSDYWLSFDSESEFGIIIASEGEKNVERVNSILNEVFARLKETNWIESSRIDFVAISEFKFPEKCDLFSRILNREALKKLSCEDSTIEPTRIQIVCAKKDKKETVAFSLLKRKKERIAEIKLYRWRLDNFPPNITRETIQTLKNKSTDVSNLAEEN
jgi:hypothetical protein